MSRPSPDPLGSDEDYLEQTETLDEDDLNTDPLEGGMDPPEDWEAADRYGTTATEQATERPLDDRLAEEWADPSAQAAERPRSSAQTPLDELDESVDDQRGDVGAATADLAEEGEPGGSTEEADAAEDPDEIRTWEGEVLVGDEVDRTGESSTRRGGKLINEPDQPAADEIVRPREEGQAGEVP